MGMRKGRSSAVTVPCDGGEEEGGDGAPAGSCARREGGEVKEVEEGEARDAGADEERHEEAEPEVVEALQADDLRHDQPRIPHHRPIEHLRLQSPPSLRLYRRLRRRDLRSPGRRARSCGWVWGFGGISVSRPGWMSGLVVFRSRP